MIVAARRRSNWTNRGCSKNKDTYLSNHAPPSKQKLPELSAVQNIWNSLAKYYNTARSVLDCYFTSAGLPISVGAPMWLNVPAGDSSAARKKIICAINVGASSDPSKAIDINGQKYPVMEVSQVPHTFQHITRTEARSPSGIRTHFKHDLLWK